MDLEKRKDLFHLTLPKLEEKKNEELSVKESIPFNHILKKSMQTIKNHIILPTPLHFIPIHPP